MTPPLSHGTNIGGGLRNGLNVIRKDAEIYPEAARNKKVFILLSDGEDNSAELDAAVDAVREQDVKVHTVGVGSAEDVPIPIAYERGRPVYLEDDQGKRIMTRFDERTLHWIAEKTGGKFYRSLSGFELDKTFSEIVRKERDITGFRKVVEYQDFYHGFLLAAAGIFLFDELFNLRTVSMPCDHARKHDDRRVTGQFRSHPGGGARDQ